ncbi:MAG: hypothetical protein Q7J64_01755 [Elusimicrobiota bacterium]|nr:hypothetical protein [Elusimicrobiota bacterium]
MKRPTCLQYALTPPEFAFLLAAKMTSLPSLKRDVDAYSSGGDQDALVLVWRKRVKEAAARSLEPAGGKPSSAVKSYLGGRLSVAKGAGLLVGGSAEMQRLDSRPETAAESIELKERLRAVFEHIESLSLDDVTGLATATDTSQQTDYLGRWIADCLKPAGGIAQVARSRLPACRRALGGLEPMAKAAR